MYGVQYLIKDIYFNQICTAVYIAWNRLINLSLQVLDKFVILYISMLFFKKMNIHYCVPFFSAIIFECLFWRNSLKNSNWKEVGKWKSDRALGWRSEPYNLEIRRSIFMIWRFCGFSFFTVKLILFFDNGGDRFRRDMHRDKWHVEVQDLVNHLEKP